MKFPKLSSPRTIRERLMLLNSITFVFILTLVSIYTYQLVSLENKLVTMEQVDDLFNSILELRRYEKNIMLRLNGDSVMAAEHSLVGVGTSLEKLAPKISTPDKKTLFSALRDNFHEYEAVFNSWCADEKCTSGSTRGKESYLVREQGRKLVKNAAELVTLNRKDISLSFKGLLFWLTFMPAFVFMGGAILFFSQVKRILKRLASLKQGTKNLAAGEFKVIPVTDTSPDEISALIDNFNQMVETLEQKQEQLVQSKKMASIGTFSSGIAHEINNPLNNISLSTDTLLEEYETMDKEEILEVLNDIMEQTDRASNIVKNLLDFSRAQTSEMQPLYIDYILHKTTNLIINELRIHKITLEKEIDDRLPRVNGDLQKLQQVFLNLIINAEQAIGDHGTITVRAQETDDGYIRTDIRDTGTGIPRENLEQLFDPFFTTKEAGKGTGLGLSIAYGIVKEHGGYIEVASEPGKGTTFSVYLPAIKQDKETTTPYPDSSHKQ